MRTRPRQVSKVSIATLGFFTLLLAFLSASFKESTLLLIVSDLNVVGLYYGDRYGRLVTLLCLLGSGIILQRSQVRTLLSILCIFTSMAGLVIMEQWEPTKRSRNTELSRDLPLHPDLLSMLFGSSSTTGLRSPDRKWLSLALHGVLQHVVPLKMPQFDIGGKLPLFSTRAYKTLSVKEVREGIVSSTIASIINSQRGQRGPDMPVTVSGSAAALSSQLGSKKQTELELESEKSNGGILDTLWGVFSSESSGKDTKSDVDTSKIGPTGGFDSIIDFSYIADENTKIEVEIPMELPLWGTLSVPVMVASPEISGSLQLEFRHDVIPTEEIDDVPPPAGSPPSFRKVLAIAFMFEPIKQIHIHGIHISMASQFQLIQYIPMVKNYMKQAVNSALIPDTRRVMLFDSSFSSLGAFQLKKEEIWNISGLLRRSKEDSKESAPESYSSASPQRAHPSSSRPSNTGPSSPILVDRTGIPVPMLPVLDLSHADPESFDQSSPPPPMGFLSSTELDADVPASLQPGDAREMDGSGVEYPTLNLT